MLLFRIFIYLCIFFIIFHLLTRKFINPYTLIMVFGKKGSGKSTYLSSVAQSHLRRGWQVFSTVAIQGTVLFNPSEFGYRKFPEKSVILIDEVSLIWSNRDFKKWDKNVEAAFRMQRHYKWKIYLFSQSFDVDKKIRDLTDSMYLLKKFARVWSVVRKIDKRVTVSQPQTDDDGNQKNGALVEDYRFAPIIFPDALHFLFIPHWIGFHDSFSQDLELRECSNVLIPYTNSQERKITLHGWFMAQIKQFLHNALHKVQTLRKPESNS